MAHQRHEDSDDDTYVQVGSAFKKLETEEDVLKAKARKDKEAYVTDEQGRRRFHGAFTGGFSAGYFNTVGSKEGWTPSSFVSSRVKKADFSNQKPEDFMDQEDFDVHGIAPRAVAAKEEFSQKQQQQGVKRAAGDIYPAVIPGESALQSLIVPAHSTIGAKLLKALGWREGEGLGPKVMRYGHKQENKVYGCTFPGEQDTSESHFMPKEAKGFMFAPKDTTPWQFEGKDDLHGIGYSGMQEQSVLGSVKATKALYGMSGEAFGLGALEEDETEDDVYGTESMTSYDLTLAGEGEISTERKYGWTGSHGTDIWGLSAFVKASKQSVPNKAYPPPDVPRDFVPVHKFFIGSLAFENKAESHKKPLTSTERSHLLSDQPGLLLIHCKTSTGSIQSGSVFSLLSAEDRERLKRVSDGAKQVVAEQTVTHTPVKEKAVAPETSSKSDKISLDNIKLFAGDPAKQKRYKAFLAGEHVQDDGNRTEWERQREREEFARTARVFQPLGSSLTSQFTRSQEEASTEGPAEVEPESDAVQAARADMFGLLTRLVEEWHPHRVLCKRFNIPDPYPGSSVVGVASGQNEVKFSSKGGGSVRSISFMHTERLIPVDEPAADEDEAPRPSLEQTPSLQSAKDHVDNKTKGGEEATNLPAKDENVEATRPSIDLFRAIFAVSSDESNVSSDEADVESVAAPSVTPQSNLSETIITKPNSQNTQTQKQWQDLSSITSISMNLTTKDTNSELPKLTLSQDYDHRKQIDSNEDSKPQPLESYGPSLPPVSDSVDINEYKRSRSVERRERHHHTKKSHKKKERKMEHKKAKHKHSKHKK